MLRYTTTVLALTLAVPLLIAAESIPEDASSLIARSDDQSWALARRSGFDMGKSEYLQFERRGKSTTPSYAAKKDLDSFKKDIEKKESALKKQLDALKKDMGKKEEALQKALKTEEQFVKKMGKGPKGRKGKVNMVKLQKAIEKHIEKKLKAFEKELMKKVEKEMKGLKSKAVKDSKKEEKKQEAKKTAKKDATKKGKRDLDSLEDLD